MSKKGNLYFILIKKLKLVACIQSLFKNENEDLVSNFRIISINSGNNNILNDGFLFFHQGSHLPLN